MRLLLALLVTLVAAISAEEKTNSLVGEPLQPNPIEAAAKQTSEEPLLKSKDDSSSNRQPTLAFADKEKPTSEGVHEELKKDNTGNENGNTPIFNVVVEVNENKATLDDQRTIGQDSKVSAEEYLRKSKKDKQKDRIKSDKDVSHVFSDFINKILQVPVELFKAMKDVIKDLTMSIQNSLPKPTTTTSA